MKERRNKNSGTTTAVSAGVHELRANRDEYIAARAFELYEQRGRKQGSDVQDWLQAERELFGSN
jgi:hypothetical protein